MLWFWPVMSWMGMSGQLQHVLPPNDLSDEGPYPVTMDVARHPPPEPYGTIDDPDVMPKYLIEESLAHCRERLKSVELLGERIRIENARVEALASKYGVRG